ncbi:shikimate dehydrogenase (NADP(+)) [Lentibacillus populi]|uniref:Shikimate dehydrogenase (NADP(+)) n=1 Tax=Lentibacillus populi TaxID=1827502 RepID=A0A9W5X466_9BACI|nr:MULTISPECIES: shikimate dehydrogenase [Bacillaceae]MBT2215085.1 shikimate dehydrogenase [Virgibacillus dakarensis]GGB28835.1 shikimate dehydrogenase (NADP(+)) [Lentibacillus populi]
MSFQFALIGYPIQHSLSPWIHEQFLKKAGLSGSYSIVEITPDESFEQRLTDLKREHINGFNVTVPYKQKIIPYLDDLDVEARRIGAVNTVVSRNGRWIGYNTDGKGYTRSLKQHYPAVFADKDIKIAIIGAGGAARGIYDALVTAGFHYVDIANRTVSSAEAITELQQDQTNTAVLSLAGLGNKLDHYDVIIQTTSVGMKPNQDKSIIQLAPSLKKDSVVSDIIYQPITTEFLKQAKNRGAYTHYGHTMLLYQAQYAFELWTMKHVPIDDMENQLQQILEGR